MKTNGVYYYRLASALLKVAEVGFEGDYKSLIKRCNKVEPNLEITVPRLASCLKKYSKHFEECGILIERKGEPHKKRRIRLYLKPPIIRAIDLINEIIRRILSRFSVKENEICCIQ